MKNEGRGIPKAALGLLVGALAILAIVVVAIVAPWPKTASGPEPGQQQAAPALPVVEEKPSAAEPETSPSPDAGPEQEAPAPAADEKATATEAAVRELVQPYGSSVAVAVVPLGAGEGFSVNGDADFVSASMIKLPVLAQYLAQVDAGALDPAEQYTVRGSDVVGGTGVIQNRGAGSSYTFDELARQMIASSDNTATNILIDRLSMDSVNARAANLGLAHTRLNRKMMDLDSGVENYISANDAAALLVGIANHTLASEEQCRRAEEYLAAQTDSEGLAEGLPAGVTFGHKTGSLAAARHDGGIVYAGQNPYVIVVLTSLDAGEANSLMARVSSAVYEGLAG